MTDLQSPLVSIVIICYNRKEFLREVLKTVLAQSYQNIEIIVIDNNSVDGTEAMFHDEFKQDMIKYLKLDENLGVSGGRNVGMNMATGEYLIMLDDDALLLDTDAIKIAVQRFQSNQRIGALAFKIIDVDTQKIQKHYRVTRDPNIDTEKEFFNWGFRGAGHAIRKDVWDLVGPYPDYYPWGHEEFDLSLKILDANFQILYFPTVVVAHYRATTGRLPSTQFRAVALENRIKVALRNLPWRFVFTTAILWTARVFFIQTRLNGKSIWIAYSNLWKKRKSILDERHPIRWKTIRVAKDLGAPLWF